MTTTYLDSKPQSWVPYQPTRGCSQGFCSIYCPQWCYIIFPPPLPPPPPLDFSDEASGTVFSPLVIVILVSAFLLVSYYMIASKYCGNSSPFRRRRDAVTDDDSGGGSGGEVHHHEAWHVTVSEGLDEAVIKSIAISKYKKGNGSVTDCSVCLTEFQEDENLRLLPKCGHAFHLQCIDTWLKSHSNCPLCRANVVAPTEAAEPICDGNYINTSIGDNDRDQDEASGDDKDPTRANVELQRIRGRDVVIDIRDGRIQATSARGSQVLISDVLEMGMEDDYSLATDDGAGSSSQIDRYGLNNKVSTSTSS